jgi:RNA 3'-terminal phosphate cyclase (ATP)
MRVDVPGSLPPLAIDGSHGEGGGQILRTALALAAITTRPFKLINVRANRPKPGLAAQHLTAVRAAAAICDANVESDHLGSVMLGFAPRRSVRAGDYLFDIAEAREGGSAGSVALVLQTVMLPLVFADGRSTVVIRGGTHVPWSPTVDYVQEVWLPTLLEMGVRAEVELLHSGWYPAGGGEVRISVEGLAGSVLAPLCRVDRGALNRVSGRAVAANLPAHIPYRMCERARSLLQAEGIAAEIRVEQLSAACPGAGILLVAHYAGGRAGSTSLGARGKPSEIVAEEAVAQLLAHHRSGAAVDAHLGDQLVLPAAFASAQSHYSVERVTRHLTTNCWLTERFDAARVSISGVEGEAGRVTIAPTGRLAARSGILTNR